MQRWLEDPEMKDILSNQFPHVRGFQSPVCLERHECARVERAGFYQFVNIGNVHWVFVSADGSNGNIYVFDSLASEALLTREKFVHTLSSILRHDGDSLKVVSQCIQQQTNGHMCGVFSIANAVSLCFGKHPRFINYDERNMRSHLLRCLRRRRFEMFPHVEFPFSWPVLAWQSHSYVFPLICTCRTPQSSDDPLNLGKVLKCVSCNRMFHEVCVGLPRSVNERVEQVAYKCESCLTTD